MPSLSADDLVQPLAIGIWRKYVICSPSTTNHSLFSESICSQLLRTFPLQFSPNPPWTFQVTPLGLPLPPPNQRLPMACIILEPLISFLSSQWTSQEQEIEMHCCLDSCDVTLVWSSIYLTDWSFFFDEQPAAPNLELWLWPSPLPNYWMISNTLMILNSIAVSMLPKLCIIIGFSNPTWPQEIYYC